MQNFDINFKGIYPSHCYRMQIWQMINKYMKFQVNLTNGCRDNGHPNTLTQLCYGRMNDQAERRNYVDF